MGGMQMGGNVREAATGIWRGEQLFSVGNMRQIDNPSQEHDNFTTINRSLNSLSMATQAPTGRTRGPALEPNAFSADDVIPTQVPRVLQVPSAPVSISEPSLWSAPTTSSSSSSSVQIPPTHPPPNSSSSTHMTQDEEDRVASNLIKNMPAFPGGSKGSDDWPLFWACLSSIMKLSRYSPLGNKLVTTYGNGGNSGNSNRLHFLLLSKLTDALMALFYHNSAYDGKGFEMVAHLRQHYAPSTEDDVFVNWQTLLFLEMGVPRVCCAIRRSYPHCELVA